jgi:hypothetical protein
MFLKTHPLACKLTTQIFLCFKLQFLKMPNNSVSIIQFKIILLIREIKCPKPSLFANCYYIGVEADPTIWNEQWGCA